MSTPVLIVCPLCAARYAGVVNPSCTICEGAGVFGVRVPEGTPPAVAARAAGMLLGASATTGWGCSTDATKHHRFRQSALCAPSGEATGLADRSQPGTETSILGRHAGQLLVDLGLRARKARKPAKRRTKAEIEREKRTNRVQQAAMEQRMEEYRQKQERLRLETAANARVAQAYRRQHPEEFAEVMEGELAFAAIEQFAKAMPFEIRVPGMP